MKRIKELTRDEVIALSEEQLSLYLSLELALNGLPIDILDGKEARMPKYPDPIKKMFVVEGVDYAFEDIEGAKELVDVLAKVKTVSYDLDPRTYERRYYEVDGKNKGNVKSIDIYNENDLRKFERNLQKIESEEGYSKDSVDKAKDIMNDFVNYIEKIKEERQINEYLRVELEEFIKMCDDDKGKAIEMMRGIYKFNDETEEYLLKDKF